MIGYVQAIFYIFSIALSTIWIDKLGNTYSTALLLLGSSIIAAIFFNAISWKRFLANHVAITKSPILWIILSMAVLLCWWLTYEITIIGSARYLISMLFISSAASSALYSKKYSQVICCITAIASIQFFLPEANTVCLIAGVCSGVIFFIYYKVSKTYAEKYQLKSTDILATRFYLLIFASFIVCLISSPDHKSFLPSGSSFESLMAILCILGFLNMVVPNFFSQSSVMNIGAEKFSIITSLLPVVTFLLQGIILQDWNFMVFITCLFVSTILNASLIFTRLNDIKKIGTGILMRIFIVCVNS